MGCCHPLKAFKTGYKTPNGKDDYVFSWSSTDLLDVLRCKKPILIGSTSVRNVNGHLFLDDPIDIPCGYCVGCRMQRAKEWKIRNCLEMKYHDEAYFLTLTYDDAHLPVNDFGEPYLCKRDLQLFLKMIRKIIGAPVRFFACGEYGENTHRPHFHLILYAPLSGFRLLAPNQFTCPIVEAAWQRGNILVEPVTPGSIAYVSGYVEKKQKDDHWSGYPVKPFIQMSRKPGIGMRYFEDHYDGFKSSPKVYGVFSEGKPGSSALPRAFKKKLSDVDWYIKRKQFFHDHRDEFDLLDRVVYKEIDPEKIGFIKDQALLQRLEKVRKVSL